MTGTPSQAPKAVLQPLGMATSGFSADRRLMARSGAGGNVTLTAGSFGADLQLGIAPAACTRPSRISRGFSVRFRWRPGRQWSDAGAETIAQMWTPQFGERASNPKLCIGFRLGTLDGHRSVGHDGAIYGFATTLQALPDEKLGVVVVTTRDGANASVDKIADAALRGMLAARAGQASGVTAAGTPSASTDTTAPVPPARARRLVGRYALRSGKAREIEVTHRGTGLALFPSTGGGIPELRARGDTLIVDDRVFGTGARFLPNADPATSLRSGDGLTDSLVRLDRGMPTAAPASWRWPHWRVRPRLRHPLRLRAGRAALGADRVVFPLSAERGLAGTLRLPADGLYDGERIVFTATRVAARRSRGGGRTIQATHHRAEGAANQLRITPLRPVPEPHRSARGDPPAESGEFRETDLVELVKLDPTIRPRSATRRRTTSSGPKFTTRRVRSCSARRRGAGAYPPCLIRSLGYGLLIHDAYRPWYVTKIFWDATPAAKRVARVARPRRRIEAQSRVGGRSHAVRSRRQASGDGEHLRRKHQ